MIILWPAGPRYWAAEVQTEVFLGPELGFELFQLSRAQCSWLLPGLPRRPDGLLFTVSPWGQRAAPGLLRSVCGVGMLLAWGCCSCLTAASPSSPSLSSSCLEGGSWHLFLVARVVYSLPLSMRKPFPGEQSESKGLVCPLWYLSQSTSSLSDWSIQVASAFGSEYWQNSLGLLGYFLFLSLNPCSFFL